MIAFIETLIYAVFGIGYGLLKLAIFPALLVVGLVLIEFVGKRLFGDGEKKKA